MLSLGVTEEIGSLLAVVLFPLAEELAAIAVAHLGDKAIGGVFDRAIAKGIHGDADRHLGQRIAFFGARQNWRLVAEPIQIAQKHQDKQASGAQCDREMGAGNLHHENFAGRTQSRQDYFRYFRNCRLLRPYWTAPMRTTELGMDGPRTN